MQNNEAFWDRAVRLILGSVLTTLAATGRGGWGWIGLLQVATGLSGHCVLYVPFGIDTTRWTWMRRKACCGAYERSRQKE